MGEPTDSRDWFGCYKSAWGKIDLVQAAFSHPAKMAKGLAFRIVDHMIAEGWIRSGDTCLDPFGGVATLALPMMLRGMHFVAVELEEKFVALGQQNIALWNSKFSTLPGWGTARILQGDSRRLSEIVGEAGCCVGSPPFSPDQPCASQTRAKQDYHAFTRGDGTKRDHQMTSPGQLAAMKDGNVDAVIFSPPYVSGGHHPDQTGAWGGLAAHKGFADKETAGYGTTEGQMGKMPEGDISALVSSPPYEGSLQDAGTERATLRGSASGMPADYGYSKGQLGNDSPDTFWSAARQILEQVHAVLRPNGKAVWVVKGFVRRGKLVDFPAQWQALCEAVGFRLLHHHKAWLVEDRGTQEGLDGTPTRMVTQRKSFFRRLHERKRPDLAIDWEDVICLVRL